VNKKKVIDCSRSCDVKKKVEGRGVGPTLKSCTRRDEGGSIEHRKGSEGF
jgi:hypothetical protein